jgi:branched-chain amino acid transport system substrate-binding protein
MIAKKLAASLLAVTFSASIAGAQGTINVGFIAPLTGPFGPSGKELLTGARLYMQQHGDVVSGKKIKLLVRDDSANADQSKRLAQELIANDAAKIITGLAITPIALSVGALVSGAKIPGVIMGAGSSIAVAASPMVVRTVLFVATGNFHFGRVFRQVGCQNGSYDGFRLCRRHRDRELV